MPASLWWARVTVKGGFGYLFADNADLMRWPAWLQSIAAADIADYRDFGGGVYRAASFVGDRIETCLFVGPAKDAGDWEVVKSLFALESLDDEQRRMLLSGRSGEGLAELRARSSAPASASARPRSATRSRRARPHRPRSARC